MIARTRRAPSLRRRALGVALVVGVALTGCSPGGTEAGTSTRTRTVLSTLPPSTTLTVTTGSTAVTGTATAGSAAGNPATTRPSSSATSRSTGSRSSSSRPPSSRPPSSGSAPNTALAAAVSGDCPYLSTDEVAPLAGQRTGPGQVIAASPAPICVFIRADGGWMAAVRVFRTPDAAAATAAVDARIPVADSSPADRPSGWTGGYLGLPSGTTDYPQARSVYGVSKGTSAVVAWTNQPQSIRARRIAEAVIENLHL